MAKLTRKLMKLFGSEAEPDQIKKFGAFAAGDATDTTDPEVIQSLGEYLEGWFAAVVGENAPCMEDFNALCYLFAYQLNYLMQTGAPEWLATQAYFIGTVVQDGGGTLYVSLTDDNLGNALTDSAHWKNFGYRNFSAVYVADHALDALEDAVEFDATAGDLNCTLPAATAALKGKQFTITKVDASTNVIHVDLGYANQMLEAPYDSMTVLCNGTVWYMI